VIGKRSSAASEEDAVKNISFTYDTNAAKELLRVAEEATEYNGK